MTVAEDAVEAHRTAVVSLVSLDGCGPRRAWSMVDAHGSADAALAAIRTGTVHADLGLARDAHATLVETWRRALHSIDSLDPGELLAQQRRVGRVLVPHDDAWPDRLLHDPEPPVVLFARGDLPPASQLAVAVVGTRRCTGLGRRIAAEFGEALAGEGAVVVSGLALGIDAAAHLGALRAGGSVVGVVATGLDVVYPSRHSDLWAQVGSVGALITEAPAGTGPKRWRFPARNRIIAGLVDLLVVVESGAVGGSMHTVEAAMERGVEVVAVPGPVRGARSDGTNALIREGCTPICDVEDLVTAVNRVHAGPSAPAGSHDVASRRPIVVEAVRGPDRARAGEAAPGPREFRHPVGPIEQAVLRALAAGALTIDELAALVGISAGDLAGPLLGLELDGRIGQGTGGYSRIER